MPAEPPPPWLRYPGEAVEWSGWRQGEAEAWLHGIWLPFWHGLGTAERESFLRRLPPPDATWRDALLRW